MKLNIILKGKEERLGDYCRWRSSENKPILLSGYAINNNEKVEELQNKIKVG